MASLDALRDAAALTANAPIQRGSLEKVYNMITYIFQNFLGVNPAVIMNASVFLATASAFAGFLGGSVLTYIRQYFVTTVRIRPGDQLNEKVMQWYLQKHFSPSAARSLSAVTDYAEPENKDDPFGISRRMRRPGGRGSGSPRKIAAVPVRLLPRNTNHYMIYDRNIVSISFSDRALDGNLSYTGFARDKKDVITIECLGRSAKTIEKLILEAHLYSVAEAKAKTNIYRLSAGEWILNSAKSSRRIDTVIVEKSKQDALIEDIKDFLLPSTRDWYSKHGIPYRRGYLFSGPPGTGKSSLTAALAGLFGLDIYTMSLEDPYVNGDGSLMSILSDVSANSMLLFEDIDVALSKRRINKTENSQQGIGRGRDPSNNGYITLSGLLNAIDGIASATGRILIMTTNRPEELDTALTRPGRVDLRVDFKLPRRPEIQLLFQTFYTDLVDDSALAIGETTDTKVTANEIGVEKIRGFTMADLISLARKFADLIPENKLSFAALQGHLLRYKRDPHAAIDNTAAWLELYEQEEEQDKEDAIIEEENKKNAQMPLGIPGMPLMRHVQATRM